jgi:hypothetical protein
MDLGGSYARRSLVFEPVGTAASGCVEYRLKHDE